jgi:hypothetical protein
VSRYLQIAVGAGLYLLDASGVLDGDGDGGAEVGPRGDGLARVDLRLLFGEPAGQRGSRIGIARAAGGPAVLVVDQVLGFAEYDDAEFCPLPPIGPLGALFDVVALRGSNERPALRLRLEHALAAAAAAAAAAG